MTRVTAQSYRRGPFDPFPQLGRCHDPAGVVREKLRVRFWDKLRALELLARYVGLDRPPPPLTAVLDALPEHVRVEVVAALFAPPA